MPVLLIPALPRVDKALRLASAPARQESEFTIFLRLPFRSWLDTLDAANLLLAVVLAVSLFLPLQPQPQPSPAASTAVEAASDFAFDAIIMVRVRSLLPTPVLPFVDIARRRASEAALLLLPALLLMAAATPFPAEGKTVGWEVAVVRG
jgi:hypothetical protein